MVARTMGPAGMSGAREMAAARSGSGWQAGARWRSMPVTPAAKAPPPSPPSSPPAATPCRPCRAASAGWRSAGGQPAPHAQALRQAHTRVQIIVGRGRLQVCSLRLPPQVLLGAKHVQPGLHAGNAGRQVCPPGASTASYSALQESGMVRRALQSGKKALCAQPPPGLHIP